MINSTSLLSIHTCEQTGNKIITNQYTISNPIWVAFKALELNILENDTSYFILHSNVFCSKNDSSFWISEYHYEVNAFVKIFEMDLCSLTSQNCFDLTNALFCFYSGITEEFKEYAFGSLSFIPLKAYMSVYSSSSYIRIPLYTNAEEKLIKNYLELSEFDNSVVF